MYTGTALTQFTCLSPSSFILNEGEGKAGWALAWRGTNSRWSCFLCLEVLEKPCSRVLVKMSPTGEPRIGMQMGWEVEIRALERALTFVIKGIKHVGPDVPSQSSIT